MPTQPQPYIIYTLNGIFIVLPWKCLRGILILRAFHLIHFTAFQKPNIFNSRCIQSTLSDVTYYMVALFVWRHIVCFTKSHVTNAHVCLCVMNGKYVLLREEACTLATQSLKIYLQHVLFPDWALIHIFQWIRDK